MRSPMITLSIFAALAALCPLTLAGPAAAGHDEARPAFTDGSLTGSWGFSASGVIVPPALPAPTHVAAVGVMKFDGAGACVITDTINFGGESIPHRRSLDCAYQVNPDGSGTITAQFTGEPGPVPLSFVITDRARGLHFIRTDPGIAAGMAQRQHPAAH